MSTQNLSIIPQFLTEAQCSRILDSILSFKETNTVPHVLRENPERNLDYHVIDGELISKHFPEIIQLMPDVQKKIDSFISTPLQPLPNHRVAVNVNITKPGGEYRWHYDRNAVTALLYLNEVEGGEIEIFENYRLLLKSSGFSSFQKLLDRILLTKVFRAIFSWKHRLIPAKGGELIIMKANRCLHSVRQVRGTKDRICIVFAFDTPGKIHPIEKELDTYLYSDQSTKNTDPNYL